MEEQVYYEFVLLVDDLYMCNADERGKCKDVFNDENIPVVQMEYTNYFGI